MATEKGHQRHFLDDFVKGNSFDKIMPDRVSFVALHREKLMLLDDRTQSLTTSWSLLIGRPQWHPQQVDFLIIDQPPRFIHVSLLLLIEENIS